MLRQHQYLFLFKSRNKFIRSYLLDDRSDLPQKERFQVALLHKISEAFVQVLEHHTKMSSVGEGFVKLDNVGLVRVEH